MNYKSVPYTAFILTLLSLTGMGSSVVQPLFATSESEETTDEFDGTTGGTDEITPPQNYTETELLAFAVEHLRQALQFYIEGNTEQAQENLVISQEQIAQVQIIQQRAR